MEANAETRNAIRVVIYQRRPRLAIGIAKVLESVEIVQVVGRTGDPEHLRQIAQSLRPDVVVLDGDRPGMPLADLCKGVRESRDVGIVLLSIESRLGPLSEAVTAGIDSVVRQPFHPRDLVLAVLQGALRTQLKGNLATLQEVEVTMQANTNLATGRLQPILAWALGRGEDISPRLREDLDAGSPGQWAS